MPKTASALLRLLFGAFVLVVLLCAGDVAAGLAFATFAPIAKPPVTRTPGIVRTAPLLVVFGDSLGQGYQATPGHGWVDLVRGRLHHYERDAVVVNESIGGSRVIDLRRQVAYAPRVPARAVLVVAGGNDLMMVTDPFSFARADLALLGDIRRRYPQARIVVANLPDISWRSFHFKPNAPAEPLSAPMRLGLAQFTAVDDTILEEIAHRSGADVLDLHGLTVNGDAETPGLRRLSLEEFARRYVSDDGLHPSGTGYALLSDFAWPQIARAMRIPQDGATRPAERAP